MLDPAPGVDSCGVACGSCPARGLCADDGADPMSAEEREFVLASLSAS